MSNTCKDLTRTNLINHFCSSYIWFTGCNLPKRNENKRKLLGRKVYGKSYYNLQHTEKYMYNNNQVQQESYRRKSEITLYIVQYT